MKTFTIEEITDEYIGKRGTKSREKFESELKADLVRSSVKRNRKTSTAQHQVKEGTVKLSGLPSVKP